MHMRAYIYIYTLQDITSFGELAGAQAEPIATVSLEEGGDRLGPGINRYDGRGWRLGGGAAAINHPGTRRKRECCDEIFGKWLSHVLYDLLVFVSVITG